MKEHDPKLLEDLRVLAAGQQPADLTRPGALAAIVDPRTGLYRSFARQVIGAGMSMRQLEALSVPAPTAESERPTPPDGESPPPRELKDVRTLADYRDFKKERGA